MLNENHYSSTPIIFFLLISGAFGYFETTHDITKYTKAAPFESIGKKTPMAIRFSTVGQYSKSSISIVNSNFRRRKSIFSVSIQFIVTPL